LISHRVLLTKPNCAADREDKKIKPLFRDIPINFVDMELERMEVVKGFLGGGPPLIGFIDLSAQTTFAVCWASSASPISDRLADIAARARARSPMRAKSARFRQRDGIDPRFCMPITGTKVPAGPEWLHEIKYDGFRLRVERDGNRVRLITRGGYDWTKRYPRVVEAALKNRQKQFVLDGEAVILGVDGISDFNALHSGKHSEEVQLCAFDLLAMDGDDLRDLPLSMRKANLARLLARRPDGIFLSEFEVGEIGPDLFREACQFGLEGLVSKHRDRPYRGGRQKRWIKVKNRKHLAFDRVKEAFS
jgi:bifunctional non-homologous end joining protein LigD